MDRNELEFELGNLEKEKLVSLFLKLKDVNLKLMQRINLLEGQIDELTDFDTLFESVK